MAGDWIKVEKATARKPEVMAIADELGIHVDHAFGMCVRFWSWCDDQMTDGHARRVTNVTLDASFGHDGFATALVNVGWLRVREGSLEVPNFDRHLSESAKNRALSGMRKRKQRVKDVTEMSRCERDKSVTREKRREDKDTHTHTEGEAVVVERHERLAGRPRTPDPATDGCGWALDEWTAFASAWNATERAEPWRHLTPPDGWADLAASPGWIERARQALSMLPSRRYFERPLPVTKFFEWIDRIRAGEFADPKEQRNGRAMAGAGKAPRRGNL